MSRAQQQTNFKRTPGNVNKSETSLYQGALDLIYYAVEIKDIKCIDFKHEINVIDID